MDSKKAEKERGQAFCLTLSNSLSSITDNPLPAVRGINHKRMPQAELRRMFPILLTLTSMSQLCCDLNPNEKCRVLGIFRREI